MQLTELAPFLQEYTATHTQKAGPEILKKYGQKVPAALLALWEHYGFGKYNHGILEIVNPDDFNDTLWTWLGKEVATYTPIAINGFGDLFYYRQLGNEEEDVCMITPHYRDITNCCWSLTGFFNHIVCDKEFIDSVLRKELFTAAIKRYGELSGNESFHFVPALAIGGTESLDTLQKGNTQIHLDILFQIGS